jgi:Xaa-Pro aminopeptidase
MFKVPMSEVAGRIVSLQTLLRQNGIDAAVIRQNTDLYYFTGTVQDAHLVIPAVGQPLFLVRRDVERAREQSPIRPVIPLKSLAELPPMVFEACGTESPAKLGFELDVLPTSLFFLYDEKMFPRQQIVDVGNLIRQVRMVKSPWEIERMRDAAGISALIAEAVPTLIKEGVSEMEVSADLEAFARKSGHTGLLRFRAFNMEIVFGHILSGPEAATSAYMDAPTGGLGMSPSFGQGPSGRRIKPHEVVSVDTMVSNHGYLNDQTRNYSIGEPPARLMEGYRLVRDIHDRFRSLARPGAISGQLYETVLSWVEKEGWSEWFMGSGEMRVSFVGHGIGLEVDEPPFIAAGQLLALREGMTFAFEPKFIVPDVGIVGLENTYVVTATGIESLNTASEEFVIL